MGFTIFRYVVGLALFAGAVYLFASHVDATLRAADAATPAAPAAPAAPEGAETASAPVERTVVDILKLSVAGSPSSPAWYLGVGAVLAALGLVVARPPFRKAAALEAGRQ